MPGRCSVGWTVSSLFGCCTRPGGRQGVKGEIAGCLSFLCHPVTLVGVEVPGAGAMSRIWMCSSVPARGQNKIRPSWPKQVQRITGVRGALRTVLQLKLDSSAGTHRQPTDWMYSRRSSCCAEDLTRQSIPRRIFGVPTKDASHVEERRVTYRREPRHTPVFARC